MPMHIVQVEDNSPLRDILKIALDAAEPELVLAQFVTGDDAVSYIQVNAADIDLFILDVRLPGYLSGLQLAAFVRAIHCPGYIVLTSGYGSPSQKVLKAIGSEFVPKPWHIPELTENLFRYHIEKPTQASAPSVTLSSNANGTYRDNARSNVLQARAPERPHRVTLSRKVATSECRKAVAGSGLLHRLILKMRTL